MRHKLTFGADGMIHYWPHQCLENVEKGYRVRSGSKISVINSLWTQSVTTGGGGNVTGSGREGVLHKCHADHIKSHHLQRPWLTDKGSVQASVSHGSLHYLDFLTLDPRVFWNLLFNGDLLQSVNFFSFSACFCLCLSVPVSLSVCLSFLSLTPSLSIKFWPFPFFLSVTSLCYSYRVPFSLIVLTVCLSVSLTVLTVCLSLQPLSLSVVCLSNYSHSVCLSNCSHCLYL